LRKEIAIEARSRATNTASGQNHGTALIHRARDLEAEPRPFGNGHLFPRIA
jgi:hypothetical protein